MFACAASGMAALLNIGEPITLIRLMPRFMVDVWGWNLMLGGLLGLIAPWWRDRITGLLLERVALLCLGGITAVYAVALYVIWGSQAVMSIPLTGSITVASLWRVVHINRELKVLTRWIERFL